MRFITKKGLIQIKGFNLTNAVDTISL